MNNKLVYMNFKKYLMAALNFSSSVFDDKRMHINSSVHLDSKHDIPEMPNGLTINGYLNLNNTSIKVLPDDLTITGYLTIGNNSQIEVLPRNLSCSTLYARGETKIKNVPDYTFVNLAISVTSLEKFKYEYVGGYVIENDEGFSVLIPTVIANQKWLLSGIAF